MRGDEGLELGDERVLASEREVRLDPGLECCQPELFETGDLRLGEGLEGEVCECRSAPECEGIPKRRGSLLCLIACELPPAALQQSLEAECIQLFRPYAQQVARGLLEQELCSGSVGEESPQPREIDVEDRVDGLWDSIRPELLDESLARDGLVRVYEQEAEERALFRATERECSPTPDDFKRPEDPKLEIRLLLRGPMVRPSSCG
jgi:hypothetical protein